MCVYSHPSTLVCRRGPQPHASPLWLPATPFKRQSCHIKHVRSTEKPAWQRACAPHHKRASPHPRRDSAFSLSRVRRAYSGVATFWRTSSPHAAQSAQEAPSAILDPFPGTERPPPNLAGSEEAARFPIANQTQADDQIPIAAAGQKLSAVDDYDPAGYLAPRSTHVDGNEAASLGMTAYELPAATGCPIVQLSAVRTALHPTVQMPVQMQVERLGHQPISQPAE